MFLQKRVRGEKLQKRYKSNKKNYAFVHMSKLRCSFLAVCDPPCQNGGICKNSGKCKCPFGFKGSQCQLVRKRRKKKP